MSDQIVPATCNTPGFAGGIFHVHPTLNCNLKCVHCYSDSWPGLKKAIPASDFAGLLEFLAGSSFDVLSVSGGEPFLYRELPLLLEKAKALGFRTQAVTNGTLMHSTVAKVSLPLLDLLAISIDGMESRHNKIRGIEGSFAKTVEGLKYLSDKSVRMALIHALTPGSWEEMHDIVQMALEVGASLVQFHPLEWSGRAQNAFESGLEVEELHRAYIMYHALEAEYGQKIRIHMDIVHSDLAREEPVKVGMLPPAPITDIQSLFNACRSLVLDDQGKLMPFSYGMHPDYHIGSLAGNSRQDVDAAFSAYFKYGVAGFEELLHSSYQSAIADDNDLLVWSDYVVSKSHSKSAGGVLAI